MCYNRFVIVGQERTGSNLLLVLLASHPDVMAFGELFNPAEEIRRTVRRIPDIIHPSDDAVEYLEKCIYREYPENIQAVGFKLFYSHARNPEWKDLWEFLKDASVTILHLKRRNLLDRYLSHQLAVRSGKWIALQGEDDAAYEPILLDPVDCVKDFHRSLWYQERINEFFRDNPKLEIVYEDLRNDHGRQSTRIQESLGLEYRELWAKTRIQRTQRKHEVISNYDDVRAWVATGIARGWARQEWIDFFDGE